MNQASTPRKASRDQRRQQLIDATIDTIAKRGYARTTLTDVANTAGLSHGLVNFHFETKEKLLTETLLFLAAEYRDNWVKALAEAPSPAAAQLDALIRADFNDVICSPERLSAWCSFWGEAQCRPIYQQECGSNDIEYADMIESICARLVDEGGYKAEAKRVARIMRVIMEGVWLDLMTMTTPYSREEAMRTVHACAAAFFPRHFNEDGLIAR
ncbi:MAG: TetR family transcriptional regulator C-terminal domain-containing protein [Phyllobacteriaceae bacterium]|nr:TetR family transcriptional regulator C-terminal domain-containing protein [Phyllobacteriaceae bacterium]